LLILVKCKSSQRSESKAVNETERPIRHPNIPDAFLPGDKESIMSKVNLNAVTSGYNSANL
jgi:hypothetical protein